MTPVMEAVGGIFFVLLLYLGARAALLWFDNYRKLKEELRELRAKDQSNGPQDSKDEANAST